MSELQRRTPAVAADPFGREGFHGATADAIASASCLSLKAPYAAFSSKEELCTAAIADRYESFATGAGRPALNAGGLILFMRRSGH